MKKALFAAALLSSAGLSQAQSSVTIYGLVDLNITNNRGTTPAGSTSTTLMNDGHVNDKGSRLGFSSVEDLGDGMKVGMLGEMGIFADTGNLGQSGRLFGRQVYAWGSSTRLGELRMGRQYALHDEVWSNFTNPFPNALVLNPNLGVNNLGTNLAPTIDASRIDNDIHYLSPMFGNFQVQVQVAPGESVNDRYQGVKLSYVTTPWKLAYAYEWNTDKTTGQRTNKLHLVGAAYDFGVAQIMGGYQKVSELTKGNLQGTGAPGTAASFNLQVSGSVAPFDMKSLTAYTAGVLVPLGRLSIGANYSHTLYRGAAGQRQTLGKYGLGALYDLSKTFSLYAGVSLASGDLSNYIAERRVLQAGVRKFF